MHMYECAWVAEASLHVIGSGKTTGGSRVKETSKRSKTGKAQRRYDLSWQTHTHEPVVITFPLSALNVIEGRRNSSSTSYERLQNFARHVIEWKSLIFPSHRNPALVNGS